MGSSEEKRKIVRCIPKALPGRHSSMKPKRHFGTPVFSNKPLALLITREWTLFSKMVSGSRISVTKGIWFWFKIPVLSFKRISRVPAGSCAPIHSTPRLRKICVTFSRRRKARMEHQIRNGFVIRLNCSLPNPDDGFSADFPCWPSLFHIGNRSVRPESPCLCPRPESDPPCL